MKISIIRCMCFAPQIELILWQGWRWYSDINSYNHLQDRIYTYDYVNRQANKVAHTALKLGLKKGDVVSILITNSPEFIWTFIGKWLAKVLYFKTGLLIHAGFYQGTKIAVKNHTNGLKESSYEEVMWTKNHFNVDEIFRQTWMSVYQRNVHHYQKSSLVYHHYEDNVLP